jgi:hypothetical protein
VKKNLLSSILLALILWTTLGCGVRGDPMPPEKPISLGRGKPNYKKATEELAFPRVPPVNDDDDKDKEESADEKDED